MTVALVTVFSITFIPTDTFAQALRVLTGPQGGTGIGTATGGDIGTCLKVLSISPLTYELGTCGSGSGSGGTDTLFNWNTGTNIISTDGSSTTATTSLSTNGFTANNATITNATSTTGWFSSIVRALNAVFTSATTTNLGTSEFRALSSSGISIHSNSGSEIANFGVGGGTNATFNGGVNITGALGVTGNTGLTTYTANSGTTTNASSTNFFATNASTSVFHGAGLTDCSSASNALTYVSSTGKFGCNTILGGGGGGGGGWATTTDNNAEIGEIVAYTPYDAYIGGSSSSTASFNFDQDSTIFTIGAPTSVATGSILTQYGVLLFGSSTAETINLDFRTSDVVRLTSSTSVLAFDFGDIKASSTNASTSVLTVHGNIFSPKSDGCASWSSGILTTTGTACGSGGGGGGSISTSSIPVAGNLAYWTSGSTLSDVATGTLTETVTGLELSATRGLVGGSAVLSLTSGYTVPTTSSTTEWGTFYQTPSTRITDGTGLTWSSNTLNCDTANGSTQGCLTSVDWTSFNNKVSSTSIDTSSELAALLTDETGTAGSVVFSVSPVFTGTPTFVNFFATGTTTLGFASSTALTVANNSYLNTYTANSGTTTNSTSTNLSVSGSLKLFGGTTVTSNNALCILLTGSAGLCDGTDDTGTGGSTLKPYSWYVDADGAGDYTTIQGALDQCAVVGGGSIYLTDPYYFIGGTGLVFKSNDCQVIGIYASTTIEVSGATTAFKTNSAASTYANVGVQNVVIVGDGTAGSVGIDMSDMIRSRYTGIIMDNVDIGFKLNDTQNVSFYNTVRDFAITTIGSYGIYASSTNPTNDNKFSDGFIGCTAGCTGIHLNNAQANSFTNVSIEPATQSGTIGVKIDVSNSATNNGTFANKFTNLYAEANGVGIAASTTIGTKIVLGNTFDGGQIVANTTDVIDSSNGAGAIQFNGSIVNYDISNKFATTTMTFATTSKLAVSGSIFDTNGNAGTNNQVLTSTGTSTLWRTVSASGDGVSNWLLNAGADALTPSSTKGIVISASSSILSLTTQSATTTNLTINSERFTDLTGFGLTNSSGALGLNTTGAADGECLVYESTGPTIDWASCGGAGGSKWTDGTNFTYLTNTTYDLALGSNATETAPFWWDVSATTSYIGNGGAGDSVLTFGPTGSEWTMGFDDTDDSFRISSSTSLGTFDFLRLYSTSSLTYNATSSTNLVRGFSAAFNGLPKFLENSGSPVENFTNGMVGSSFMYLNCDAGTMNAAATAETIGHRCGDAAYYEDATGATSANASVAFGGITLQAVSLAEATANSGAGFFFENSATPVLTLGSTTPRLSGLARVNAGASSTVYAGFTNTSPVGTAYEVMPTAFVGFIATSTYPNWTATVRTSASASTSVDTGVPSTSPLFFDIQTDSGYAYLWYGSNTLSKRIAFDTPVSIGPIVNTGVAPGFYIGRVLGGSTAVQAYLQYMEYWKRKPYMYYKY